MRLYLQYLKYTFQTAKKNPQKALKIFPGLGFLIFGIAYYVFIVSTRSVSEFVSGQEHLGILYAFVVASFMPLMFLIALTTNSGLGFRASDANFLMKAPITNFDAYNFVILKQSIMLIGLSIFMFATQSQGILMLTGNKMILVTGVVTFLISTFTCMYLSYILFQFKISNILITRIVSIVCIGFVVVLFLGGNYFLNEKLVELTWIQWIPIFGWNYGIMVNTVYNQPVMLTILFALQIVTFIVVYYIAKKQNYFFYEYELAYVAKTEKAYTKMQSGRSEDIKLFKQSNIQFKHLNEKAILDLSNMRGGKFWFMSMLKVIGLAISIGIPIFVFSTIDVDPVVFLAFISVLGTLYLSLIGSQTIQDNVFIDFYLRLSPIKTIYKIIYTNIVGLKMIALEVICFSIATLGAIKYFDVNVSILEVMLAILSVVLIKTAELFFSQNILTYLFAKIGKILSAILSFVKMMVMVALFGATALVVAKMVSTTMGLIVLNILLAIYLVFALWIATFIYDKMDVGSFKNSENL